MGFCGCSGPDVSYLLVLNNEDYHEDYYLVGHLI